MFYFKTLHNAGGTDRRPHQAVRKQSARDHTETAQSH